MDRHLLVLLRSDIAALYVQINRLLERSLQNHLFLGLGFELHSWVKDFLLGNVLVRYSVELLRRFANELSPQVIVNLDLLLDLGGVVRVHLHVYLLFKG